MKGYERQLVPGNGRQVPGGAGLWWETRGCGRAVENGRLRQVRDGYAMKRQLEYRVYLEGYGGKGEGEERGRNRKGVGERERQQPPRDRKRAQTGGGRRRKMGVSRWGLPLKMSG